MHICMCTCIQYKHKFMYTCAVDSEREKKGGVALAEWKNSQEAAACDLKGIRTAGYFPRGHRRSG